MISVVIPTRNEAHSLPALVAALRRELPDGLGEILVSDGGSTDGTVEVARRLGATVVEGTRGRGPQLNAGVAAAHGERLWFLHADTAVPPGSGAALQAATVPWGCFATRIASDDPRLRFTARWMTERARRTGACSGDMGIWADRELFDALGGFGQPAAVEAIGGSSSARVPAFEDLAFADRARRRFACEVLDPPLLTSARRWEQEGVNRTILRFWMLRMGYRVGVDPIRLSRSYRSRPR